MKIYRFAANLSIMYCEQTIRSTACSCYHIFQWRTRRLLSHLIRINLEVGAFNY